MVGIFENLDFGRNFRKISILLENLDFGPNFRKSRFRSKLFKIFDIGRTFRKISILVELFENLDLVQIFEKFRFWLKFL